MQIGEKAAKDLLDLARGLLNPWHRAAECLGKSRIFFGASEDFEVGRSVLLVSTAAAVGLILILFFDIPDESHLVHELV